MSKYQELAFECFHEHSLSILKMRQNGAVTKDVIEFVESSLLLKVGLLLLEAHNKLSLSEEELKENED